MKRFFQTAVGCLGMAAAISAHAGANVPPEILIYKYTSPRPWTQYDCYRPDIASTDATPVIPQNARVGTYTQTEYWVFDKVNNMLKPVQYYSYVVNGATVKKYEVGPTDTLTRIAYDDNDAPVTVPCVRYLPGALANTYNVSFNRGDGDSGGSTGDINDDTFNDFSSFTTQDNLMGVGKAYTVVTGMVFQKVASSMTGPYIYSDRTDYTSGSAAVHFRSLYFEAATTQTITLDAISTKSANTGASLFPYGGGPALSKGTVEYGVRVVELLLEKLGYDNADAPAGANNATVVNK